MTRPRPQVRRTVLIVAEGATDVAFLRHLRGLYCCGRERPPEVTPKRSDGGGGDSVVATLLQLDARGGYDALAALTDADRPPSARWLKSLDRKQGTHIVFAPCLEGLLLGVLDQPVPAASPDCKARLADLGVGSLVEIETYRKSFPVGMLDEARDRLRHLDALIRMFE